MKLQRNYWLWVIPVLLLATGLAVHRLDGYTMNGDERATIRLAGGRYYGPYTLAEVWAAVTTIFPDQAYGLPLIYWVWGRVFGWSTFAVRVLPLFAGVLALAWTYRLGRGLFAPVVGLVAVMLLATSVYFITYMHVARAFTLVALFAAMAIWGYWRLALRPPASGPGRAAQLGLLVGSIGIFYTHYYSVLLLAALGLWHLLMMPKGRRWWRPVLLWGLAGVVFLPELAGFLQGITWTQTQWWFISANLRTVEVLSWFLYVLTNGILRLPGVRLPLAPNIVVLVLLSLVVAFGWWRYRQRAWFRQLQFLLFITLVLLLLMLIGNEILLVISDTHLRYWMALWPMIATLVGWVVWRTRGRWRLLAGLLIGAWVAFGFWANTASQLRYEVNKLLHRYTVHPVSKKVKVYAGQLDLLLIDAQLYQAAHTSGYYFSPFPEEHLIFGDSLDPLNSRAEFSRTVGEHLRLWLLAGEAGSIEHRDMVAQLPSAMVFCDRIFDREDLVLELYAWSAVHCPNDEPAQLRFGEGIELVASEVTVVPTEMLRVDLLMHTESSTGMTAYSVALHVFDATSGEKVAQGDQGLWLGRYNPLRSDIDISGLLAGDYELRVAVYNWQTLERLAGVDLASGATGNLLTLFRFRVE